MKIRIQIERLRSKIYQVSSDGTVSLSDGIVLELSQKLDRLLNELDRIARVKRNA